MESTIRSTFDPADLPAWAQSNAVVIWLCRRDLAFRAEIGRAETPQYRAFLVLQASHRYDEWSNA